MKAGKTSIDLFLSRLDPELRRARVIETRPDLARQMTAWGAQWVSLAQEIGLACPPELILLGDAMAHQFIYIRVLDHDYALLSPEEARRERAALAVRGANYGVADRSAMLPIFGQDGDLLLLATDGIHAMAHDEMDVDDIVARSLAELLAEACAAFAHDPIASPQSK